ncbi:transcriptional regulator [Bacteroidia bacterium]|nr:transcriptional regulator [Bacteroidia bacterium]
MSQSVNIRYLVAGPNDERWGLTVHSLGHQNIRPGSPYPPRNHPNGYFFSADRGRILDEYQLLYITSGDGIFRSRSCSERRVVAGSMFLLFPGEWHSYNPGKNGWSEYWIGFKGTSMDNRVATGFFEKRNPILNAGMDEVLVELYRRAIEVASEQVIGYQHILGSLVENILGLTWSLDRRSSMRNTAAIKTINHARAMMVEGIYGDVSAEQIATKLNMGYSAFRKLFKSYTGFAPTQYINQLRMKKAKELLRSTTMTISEIAYELHFCSPEYFFTAFRHSETITPAKYRSLVQAGRDAALQEDGDEISPF